MQAGKRPIAAIAPAISLGGGTSAAGLGSGTSAGASSSLMMTSHFKRARVPSGKIGAGLKIRVVQRLGAITDVSGEDTRNSGVHNMLLKPLGFRYEKSSTSWRWDGNGDASRDPTQQLIAAAERDGVAVELVSYRPKAARGNSAKAAFAHLMEDAPAPASAPASIPAPAPPQSPPPANAAAGAVTCTGTAAGSVATGAVVGASYFDYDCLPDEAFLNLPMTALPPSSLPAVPAPPAPAPPPFTSPTHAPATAPAADDDWELPDDVLVSLPEALVSGGLPVLGSQVGGQVSGQASSQASSQANSHLSVFQSSQAIGGSQVGSQGSAGSCPAQGGTPGSPTRKQRS